MKPLLVLMLCALAGFAGAPGEVEVVPQTANLQSAVVGRPSPIIGGADAITIPQMLSYQGKLTDTLGLPVADTTYNVTFALYTQPTGGSPFWNETQTVETRGGLFSTLLGSVTPIGSMPDAGAAYLGMAVDWGLELAPRLRIASAAYAYKADSAGWAAAAAPVGVATGDLSGSYPSPTVDGLQGRAVGGTAPGYGQVLKWNGNQWAPANDSVGQAGGGTVTSVGQTMGVVCTPNPITTTGTVGFDQAYGDSRYVNVTGDSMSGMLRVGAQLLVHDKAALGSGCYNSGTAAFCAGADNSAGGNWASIAGGQDNSADGQYSHIGGGSENLTLAPWSIVVGGNLNTAEDTGAVAGGGIENSAQAYGSVVAGGELNLASGRRSFAGGGLRNEATGSAAVVAGGVQDSAKGTCSTVGGGSYNCARGDNATVGGGGQNRAEAAWATVAGGNGNHAEGSRSTISGGESNYATELWSTVGGGRSNEAAGSYATVGGGYTNAAETTSATVGGGYFNYASGAYATVPGGYHCDASGYGSFAAGSHAKARGAGSFVWSDSCTSSDTVGTTTDNRWVARARGGVYFYTNLGMTTGSYLSAGGSSWNSVSDSMTKENFRAVDKKALLETLARMRVRGYNLKSQDRSIRHIGPVAQDFYDAFGFGESNTAINMEDADGVALAAIQALYERVEIQQAEIEELKAELRRR